MRTMRLSLEAKTDLAMRALWLLEENETIAPAKRLAPDLGTTTHYLPHVMKPLIEAGWVASEPGPRGGYRLSVPLESVNVLELVEACEGPVDNQKCVLKGGPCGGSETCALHAPWMEARTSLMERLASISISDARDKE